jgi:hypothetical protein
MFGYDAACAGDVNGDGYADVVFGAPGESPRAFVYLGGAAGLSSNPTVFSQPPAQSVSLSYPSSQFGMSVARAGDVNGDGFADLVVGEPGYNSYAGAAYVYFGGATGVAGPPIVLLGSGEFGESLAGAGDTDGDGFGDLVIGAPAGAGTASLYRGGAKGPAGPAVTRAGPSGRGEFGYSVQ